METARHRKYQELHRDGYDPNNGESNGEEKGK